VFRFRGITRRPRKRSTRSVSPAYLREKEAARSLVHERIAFFNVHYKFAFGRITVRNQKTRWGSCSKKGNLNFNYRLVVIPPRLADYVIVHELCHLKEFNHGKAFWKLVAEMFPDHADARAQLRKISLR
jgi:predicted metal-dependent hydrolase